MGWYFSNEPQSKAEYIAGLLDELARAGEYKGISCHSVVIDHAVRGNHLWTALSVLDESDNRLFSYIHFDLIKSDNGCWGHKPITEDQGPCYYDCPLRLLEKAPLDASKGPYAAQWRESVMSWHKEQRERKQQSASMKSGQVWVTTEDYGSQPCILTRHIKGNQWACTINGATYKVRASMLSHQVNA